MHSIKSFSTDNSTLDLAQLWSNVLMTLNWININRNIKQQHQLYIMKRLTQTLNTQFGLR